MNTKKQPSKFKTEASVEVAETALHVSVGAAWGMLKCPALQH